MTVKLLNHTKCAFCTLLFYFALFFLKLKSPWGSACSFQKFCHKENENILKYYVYSLAIKLVSDFLLILIICFVKLNRIIGFPKIKYSHIKRSYEFSYKISNNLEEK